MPEVVKATFTLNDVSVVAQKLSRAVHQFFRDHNIGYTDMAISMPRPFNAALGWYMSGQTLTPPSVFRGVNIIPAYENKITVFAPDFQHIDISPVSINLNDPDLYA